MNKLPPEEINGKMYHPVELTSENVELFDCALCAFYEGGFCGVEICEVGCLPFERPDGLDVYYIEIREPKTK